MDPISMPSCNLLFFQMQGTFLRGQFRLAVGPNSLPTANVDVGVDGPTLATSIMVSGVPRRVM